MNIYVQCTRNGSTCYMRWEGQTQDQVTALLTNLQATDIQFIDQATYDAYTAANQPH